MAHEVDVCVGMVLIEVLRLQVSSRHLIYDLLLDHLTELVLHQVHANRALSGLSGYVSHTSFDVGGGSSRLAAAAVSRDVNVCDLILLWILACSARVRHRELIRPPHISRLLHQRGCHGLVCWHLAGKA